MRPFTHNAGLKAKVLRHLGDSARCQAFKIVIIFALSQTIARLTYVIAISLLWAYTLILIGLPA